MRLSLIILCLLSMSSCLKHYVAKDYDQYLVNNENQTNLPKTALKASYFLPTDTMQHSVVIESWTAGAGNDWIVEFGKMLEATLRSKDVRSAFAKLEKAPKKQAPGLVLVFTINQYDFAKHGAHVDLKLTALQDGKQVFAKNYQAKGKTQGGKMFWGGAFAMKNAIQQSTKDAVDQILTNAIKDLNARLLKSS